MSQLGEKTYMAISEIVKDEAISKFIKYYMDSTSGLVDHKQFVKELKKWKELKPETRSRLFYKRGGLTRYRDWETDRKSTRLNSSHSAKSRMPSSA